MARMFLEELIDSGKSMLPEPEKNLAMNDRFWRRRLPSPQELQGKILLKGSVKSLEQVKRVGTHPLSRMEGRGREKTSYPL